MLALRYIIAILGFLMVAMMLWDAFEHGVSRVDFGSLDSSIVSLGGCDR